jgi:hypothetical protein
MRLPLDPAPCNPIIVGLVEGIQKQSVNVGLLLLPFETEEGRHGS